MVTDAAGLGDKGFNDVTWKGIEQAVGELGVEARITESKDPADYVRNLSDAATDADLVVSVGVFLSGALGQVAARYPGVHFVQIEGTADAPNAAVYNFKGEEGGFLAGVVAGLKTKSGVVGMVGGMDIPPVEAYDAGYRAGVITVNELRGREVKPLVATVGSFTDSAKARSIANTMIGQGADVVFRAAGSSGLGVISAAKDHPDVYVVGEDLDIEDVLPGQILVCTLKRIDRVVFGAIEKALAGDFTPGDFVLGYADGGIALSDMRHTRELFSDGELAFLSRCEEALEEGRIVIPQTRKAVETYDQSPIAEAGGL
jgi:basic membrane protein A